MILLLTFATYVPALRNGFIWDDDDHLTRNPAMTSSDGLQRIWSSLAVSRYYPLTLTTFWVQRRLWGLNPFPYHAVNIALHAVNAVLLYTLLSKLGIRAAWAAAALWAVHPVNVESVAWITELKNTQSTLFFFLSLLFYLRFERQTGRVWLARSLLCAVAAMLSKPSTVVLPFVLLLFAWWERGRVNRRDIVRAIPFFGLAAAMSLLTILEQRGDIGRFPHDWSLASTERLILAGQSIWFYAGKVIWPLNLTFVYPRWLLDTNSLRSWLPLVGAAAVNAIVWHFRKQAWARAVMFGLGYFLVALLPVLGFLDIYYFRYSFVADHFQYLASIGPIALVAAGAATALRSRWTQLVAATVGVLTLGFLSWGHAQVFCNDETLWRDTLRKNPCAFLAHNNLGMIFKGQKRYEQAVEQFRETLQYKPNYLEAHTNLGVTLSILGRYEEALDQFQEALLIKPDSADTHNNLGVTLAMKGSTEEAIAHFSEALRIRPDFADAAYNLQAAREAQKNPKKVFGVHIGVR